MYILTEPFKTATEMTHLKRTYTIECYDWKENKLEFSDTRGNQFRLQFKGNKTIVHGKTASGKSLIVQKLQSIDGIGNVRMFDFKPYSIDNIFILTSHNKDEYILGKVKQKLIIIDRGDLMIDEEMAELINDDFNTNRYLIFARKPLGIDISPNHFGKLVNHDGIIELEYDFDVKGWR